MFTLTDAKGDDLELKSSQELLRSDDGEDNIFQCPHCDNRVLPLYGKSLSTWFSHFKCRGMLVLHHCVTLATIS